MTTSLSSPSAPEAVEVYAAYVMDDEVDPTAEIARLHGEIAAAYGTSLDRAIRIGELLTKQKETLEHGQFLPWVAEHLPFSERTAQNYMRVFAKRAELKSATVADLAGAYRLTAPRKTKPKAEARATNQHADDHQTSAGDDTAGDARPSRAEAATATDPSAATATAAQGTTSPTTVTPPDTERAGDATAASSTSSTAAPATPCDDSSGEAETTGSDDESAEQTAQGMTPKEFQVAFRAMRAFLRKYPKVAKKVIATFTGDLRKSTGRAA
jgi:hypothetical protein